LYIYHEFELVEIGTTTSKCVVDCSISYLVMMCLNLLCWSRSKLTLLKLSISGF